MPIVLTTCRRYRHLVPDFFELAFRFWPEGRVFVLDEAREGESWSAQMRRICQTIPATHFIRMSEDFFIHAPVQVELLRRLEEIARSSPDVCRIGLQTVHEGYDKVAHSLCDGILELDSKADYLGSCEASIWKRDSLLKFLEGAPDHVWACESHFTQKIRESGERVLVTEDRVLTYADATRQGEQRIKRNNGFWEILRPGDVWQRLV